MLSSLPRVRPERLGRPPLKTILGQVKFSHEPRLAADSQVISQLHDRLRSRYPRLNQEPQLTILPGVMPQTLIAWHFTDLDRSWSVILTTQSLALETSAYTTWPDFSERLREAVNALAQVVDLPLRERIGLRYINEIHDAVHTSSEWHQRINPQLLGLMGEPLFGDRFIHQITEARLHADDSIVAFRYGAVHEAGAAGLDVPFFLLDIDCYQEQPVPFSVDATLQTFGEFNELIWSLFRWSLTDNFYARLRDGDD